jgi:pimeloyl-ACP methyl ester carboxylesterase
MTPICFIPGIGADARMFEPVTARLKPAFECIAWDLPGFGSTPLRENYGFADLARWLADDLDLMGHDTVWLVGHSIGGMAGLEFAYTFPQRLEGLILCGATPAFGSRDGTFQARFLAERLGPLDAGSTMADLARAAPGELLGSRARAETARRVEMLFAEVPEAAYRQAIACLVGFDRRDALKAIATPTLLIAGEEDRNAPLKTMERMVTSLPRAAIEVLRGVGHMAPLEAPRRFAQAVRYFIEETRR